ncbi:MAG: GspH/FimT family pseudopilin [Deltaproteobacteria bacterium]|nr:GspH/FimT family pseudopilin [Deltaproteobacteria bacterium]
MKSIPGLKLGFTLLELIVVIGIIGVLAAITVPTTSSFLPGYRLNAETRKMMVNLQMARATAVRLSVRCVAVFVPGAYSAQGAVGSYLIFLDSNNNWQQDDLDGDGTVDLEERTVLVAKSMPGLVSLVSAAFNNNGGPVSSQTDPDGDSFFEITHLATSTTSIGFDSHGLAARSTAGAFVSGNVILRNNQGEWRRVTITPVGQMTMQKSKDGVNWE